MGCDAEDSIQHYAHCLRIWPEAEQRLQLTRGTTPQSRLGHFLLISRPTDADELRRRALWTGAVYMWHNLCRHSRSLHRQQAKLEALRHCLGDVLGGGCTTTSTDNIH